MKFITIFFISCLMITATLIFTACNNETKKPGVNAVQTDTSDLVPRSVRLPYFRGEYQINGASPWYGLIEIGSNNQLMKVGLDAGNNSFWVTSVQCNTPDCTQPGRQSFNMNTSSTFQWINKTVDTMSYGPWGDLLANLGQDVVGGGSKSFGAMKTLLATNYGGPSFAELDWDGGIGFPAQSPDSRITWLMQQLVNNGQVGPSNVCVSFHMNPVTKSGSVGIGVWSPSLVDTNSMLRFPFKPYTAYNNALNYLWSTQLSGWYINGQQIGNDSIFVFDTGASDFKGDTAATNAAITAINNAYNSTGKWPLMQLYMGVDKWGNQGQLNLSTEQYRQKVEKGPRMGQTVIAIDTLNVDGLILAGSVVLEDLYTVLWYNATGQPGNWVLSPVEVWMFNKKDGPTIIQNGFKKK